MRRPGIEPGSHPWQGRILPLDHHRIPKLKEIQIVYKVYPAKYYRENYLKISRGLRPLEHSLRHILKELVRGWNPLT